MIDDPTRSEPAATDPEKIQQSLRQLDRSTAWFWWNSIGFMILLSAAFATLAPPELLNRYDVLRPLDMTSIVRGLLAIMLVLNCYSLFHQRHLARVRHRVVEQMQIAVKQRMRADKFYGLAILDPLTDLYNRRYGQECLQKEITRVERHNHDLAVIVMDLDNFKDINDELGHAAGDAVLKEFSRRLKRAIRACDVPVRMGGDEFMVVLPECPRENVDIILSRLTPFEVIVNRQKLLVSYSRGRAQYQVSDTPSSLIQRADEVLYAEKATRSTAAV